MNEKIFKPSFPLLDLREGFLPFFCGSENPFPPFSDITTVTAI